MIENFEDYKFYERIRSIGYTKRIVPLPERCAMLRLTSEKPVLESEINELISIREPRNHEKNIYTALEYLIEKEKEKEKLIKIIKGIK